MEQNTSKKKKEPPLKNISLGIFLLLSILTIFLALGSKRIVLAQEKDSDGWIYLSKILNIPDPHIEKISLGPKVITVQKGKDVRKIFTTSGDIKEILEKNGFEVTENDLIYLNTQYPIDGSIIRIVETESVVVEEYLDIPYETETRKTSKYAKGVKHVVQKGLLGLKRQRILLYYEDETLVRREIIEEVIENSPRSEIIEIGTSIYSLEGITIRGYNCPYWYSVVDGGSYSEEEKRWLKFIMYCESGCNAESNKSSYKGLFQWSPYWWSRQFSENIFDGHAQIAHTIRKYRAGESTRATQWPACHAAYLRSPSGN